MGRTRWAAFVAIGVLVCLLTTTAADDADDEPSGVDVNADVSVHAASVLPNDDAPSLASEEHGSIDVTAHAVDDHENAPAPDEPSGDASVAVETHALSSAPSAGGSTQAGGFSNVGDVHSDARSAEPGADGATDVNGGVGGHVDGAEHEPAPAEPSTSDVGSVDSERSDSDAGVVTSDGAEGGTMAVGMSGDGGDGGGADDGAPAASDDAPVVAAAVDVAAGAESAPASPSAPPPRVRGAVKRFALAHDASSVEQTPAVASSAFLCRSCGVHVAHADAHMHDVRLRAARVVGTRHEPALGECGL